MDITDPSITKFFTERILEADPKEITLHTERRRFPSRFQLEAIRRSEEHLVKLIEDETKEETLLDDSQIR